MFNNYGTNKSNEELLAMYGFALPHNQADRVMLLVPSSAGVTGADAGESTICYVDRAGMTEQLLEALVANAQNAAAVLANSVGGGGRAAGAAVQGEDEDDDDALDAAELAAVTLLGQTIAAKLNTVSEFHRRPFPRAQLVIETWLCTFMSILFYLLISEMNISI